VAERVSVIATVRNERAALPGFLAGLFEQSRPADDLVIVDGGSTDGSFELLLDRARARPALRVERVPGANISAGRNAAIRAAKGSIIAVTDAGAVADPDWLARLVEPFEHNGRVGVASGWFRPGGTTRFERALGAIITPHLREVRAATFLPSSRSVAFRRQWWERVGGYPEWLPHCEDLVFDLDLRRHGAQFAFRPDAVVTWTSRSSLLQFFRQYFLYARGDGIAGLWPRRHLVRYSSYIAGTALLILGCRSTPARVALIGGLTAYFAKFERRVWRHLGWGDELAVAAPLVPLVVVTGDVAKMLGYPVGRLRRRR
jgi:cellulose synthase/poly-beta-1,6-N-acetylglucosamine synthase-like glycosyltransferase